MRRSFEAGISLPLAKRKEQLLALQQLLVENEQDIIEALKQDLSRPLVEAQYYDVLLPLSELAQVMSFPKLFANVFVRLQFVDLDLQFN